MARKKKVYLYQKQKQGNHGKMFVVLIVVIALVVAAVALIAVLVNGGTDGGDSTGQNLTPVTSMNDSKVESSSSSESEKDSSSAASESDSSPGETSGAPATHDKPVPESASVGLPYFGDALFIGDSRTEGFMMYAEVNNATYYTYKGLSVDTVATKEFIPGPDGSKQTVMDALKNRQFAKVYVMLGVNELGWAYPNIFIERYGRLIDAVKANNPGAIVYVQSILPVSQVKAGDAVYNNENINKFNALIQAMVQEKQVYYVNPAEAVMQDGWLAADAATDGVHLNKKYCIIWRDYLMTHTVLRS